MNVITRLPLERDLRRRIHLGPVHASAALVVALAVLSACGPPSTHETYDPDDLRLSRSLSPVVADPAGCLTAPDVSAAVGEQVSVAGDNDVYDACSYTGTSGTRYSIRTFGPLSEALTSYRKVSQNSDAMGLRPAPSRYGLDSFEVLVAGSGSGEVRCTVVLHGPSDQGLEVWAQLIGDGDTPPCVAAEGLADALL